MYIDNQDEKDGYDVAWKGFQICHHNVFWDTVRLGYSIYMLNKARAEDAVVMEEGSCSNTSVQEQ
jgi:hypothetical protein